MAAVRRYLLVPAAGAGEGIGHLVRCLRLSLELDGEVTFLAAFMDGGGRAHLASALRKGRQSPRRKVRVIECTRPGQRWDLVVVDKRRTTLPEHERLCALGPCLFVDEGGPAREAASFLADTLPLPPGFSRANIASPALLDLPARKSRATGKTRKVLVSFGGEDRHNLARSLIGMLVGEGFFPAAAITVVQGALSGVSTFPPGVRVLREVRDLRIELWKYDLVLTHFGLTAFESLASGVPVILLHPSRYHALLGRTAGLPGIGLLRPRPLALRRLLARPGLLAAPVKELRARLAGQKGGGMADLVGSLCPRGAPRCPVCAEPGGRVQARFPDRTYRTCGSCGVTYLEDFAPRGDRYGKDYFFAEYRAQYGRTYLEDFEAIRKASGPRAELVRRLLGNVAGGAVIDVGCAFGPFLQALCDRDMEGFGIDVSEDGVRHVREVLGLPAWRGAFEKAPRSVLPAVISAVTMWYVIEHFADVGAVLDKARGLLPEGGVLAFSTPNGRGISALKNRRAFLSKSPFDHLTIFSPRGLPRLLWARGFSLRVVRVTGHHPERFPGLLGAAARRSRAASAVLGWASRALGLGDTFEAYAVRKGQR